jgi:hypothetical protein
MLIFSSLLTDQCFLLTAHARVCSKHLLVCSSRARTQVQVLLHNKQQAARCLLLTGCIYWHPSQLALADIPPTCGDTTWVITADTCLRVRALCVLCALTYVYVLNQGEGDQIHHTRHTKHEASRKSVTCLPACHLLPREANSVVVFDLILITTAKSYRLLVATYFAACSHSSERAWVVGSLSIRGAPRPAAAGSLCWSPCVHGCSRRKRRSHRNLI